MAKVMIKNISNKIFSGGTPSTRNSSYWGGTIPWLSSGETRYDFIHKTERTITDDGVKNSSTRLAKVNSVIMASAGQGNTRGQTSFLLIDTYINQSIISIEVDESKILPKFLYYNLKSRYKEIRTLSDTSSSRGSITTKMIGNLEIDVLPMSQQQHIVDTIGSVDDLIEKNNELIEKLKNLSTLIYMRYKEKTTDYSKCSHLKDDCFIHTGKLDANAAKEDGNYRFFTCSSDYLLIDKYIYEGKSIIVAGNGVISVKYYDGKFNAYQRVYVLQPERYLFLYLKEIENNVQDLLRSANGSVIKFITKGMLEEICIPIYAETEVINNKIGKIYDYISRLEEENIILNKSKKILLHKYFD